MKCNYCDKDIGTAPGRKDPQYCSAACHKGFLDSGEGVHKQAHYAQFKIQPMEFVGLNKLDFLVGNVIKYVCRYTLKNGVEDLKKARHYLDCLIEREEKGTITL